LIVCFTMPDVAIVCERNNMPRFADVPLVVTDKDGTIRAASAEARAYGVRRGQPATFARSLCRQLVVRQYDAKTYLKTAEALWNEIAQETSVVEPVTAELVYAKIDGWDAEQRTERLTERGSHIMRTRVRSGMGRSKLLAKAALTCGRDRCVVIAGYKEADVLAAVALAPLATIPAKVCTRAEKLGLHTLGDVAALPERELERQFREAALLLTRLATGDDGDPVKAVWPPKRIEHAVAFDDEIADEFQLTHALKTCAEKIGRQLSEKQQFCRALLLVLDIAGGGVRQQREELSEPTRDAEFLHRGAIRLFGRMNIDVPVERLALTVSDICIGESMQLTVLDNETTLTSEQRISLNASLAHIKEKFGEGTVLSNKLAVGSRRTYQWTYALGHVVSEAVRVITDRRGLPVHIVRAPAVANHSRCVEYHVADIQDLWREVDWSWGVFSEQTYYRVTTVPNGLYELCERNGEWRLSAVAD
jgi:nucleotidyltransferase/DNA polymerase involved in DNA repair